MKLNEEHLGGNSTKTQAVAMMIKLRTRGYDVTYGSPAQGENLNEIPDDEFQEVLAEVLAEIPDDMEELPGSYNAALDLMWIEKGPKPSKRGWDNPGMKTEINTLLAEVATEKEAVAETMAAESLRKLAASLPTELWRKRKISWSQSHYADSNARGANEDTQYEDSRNTIVIEGCEPSTGGGQNSGHYYVSDDDDSLYFHRDGSLSTCTSVEGSWSCWQGSSSGYEMTFGRVEADDATVERVLPVVERVLREHLDALRAKHQRGATAAKALLAALEDA